MQAILNNDFDIDKPEINRGDYVAKVTKLLSGGVEIVMKVIRPMAYENQCEQRRNGYPINFGSPEEKSLFEIERTKQDNKRRALNKAKQTTRFLCQQMKADRLLTLTYRENLEDREVVKADFKQFLRLVRDGWKGQQGLKGWQYVAVLERQERGAYHVHIAVQGFQPVKFLRMCWYKALGALPNASKEETPGQINITSPRDFTGSSRKKEWATHRLASYIVKYMSKTFDETTTEKNRYWRARDIEAPVSFRHWLVATSLPEAINELLRFMDISEGMVLKSHWLSDDQTCYWVRGVCDD